MTSLNPFKKIRELYDWTLKWADHKYNLYILASLASIESIFFPIPVDPLLIAMGIAKPKRSFLFALVTTLASVGGAILGYYIGASFWHLTQDFFLTYVFSKEVFDLVSLKYNENAFFSIFLASFTPLPFKVFTISAGVTKINLVTLILASLAGRGARFFILSTLIFFFGEPIKKFIDKYFNTLIVVFTIIGTLGYFLIAKVLK